MLLNGTFTGELEAATGGVARSFLAGQLNKVLVNADGISTTWVQGADGGWIRAPSHA